MDSRDTPKVGAKARALAQRQGRAIQRGLSGQPDLHRGVHLARKAIRRLRALLALVDGRFEQVVAIDRALRKLGDGLSALRDAHVAVELAHAFAAGDNTDRWQPMISYLVQRQDRLAARLLARDPGFDRRRAIVSRQMAALDAVEWRRLRNKDLRAGLERSLARLARAERAHARNLRWRTCTGSAAACVDCACSRKPSARWPPTWPRTRPTPARTCARCAGAATTSAGARTCWHSADGSARSRYSRSPALLDQLREQLPS